MDKKRHEHIDFIRGLSIIAMIVIHVSAYFRETKLVTAIWDYSQFAVVGFVFCSAYVFTQTLPLTLDGFTTYYKKRLLRLLKPYYVFLFAYFITLYLISPRSVTPYSIGQNIVLGNGLDLNWMVLLFLELSLVMPLVLYLKQRSFIAYAIFALTTIASSIFFLQTDFANYKGVMWLPWSLVIVLAWHLRDVQKKLLPQLILLAVSLASFFWSRSILSDHSLPLLQYSNKYPPNLYHLAYGMSCITLLYIIGSHAIRYLSRIKSSIYFFSTYSYSLFFIHFWFILFMDRLGYIRKLGWGSTLIVVFTLSIGVQLTLNKLLKKKG